MHILWCILTCCGELGKSFLKKSFLEPNYHYFNYSYKFDDDGQIISKEPRHFTDRNNEETERYVRIAFDSVLEFESKNNRKTPIDLISEEEDCIRQICQRIRYFENTADIKKDIEKLVECIELRLIQSL